MPYLDKPLTTATTATVAPELLEDSVEARIVKIRPAATPLDQITRCIGSRHADSMKVSYYSVDIRPGSDTVTDDVESAELLSSGMMTVPVSNPSLFAPTDTVMFPGTKVNAPNGSEIFFTAYVVGIDGSNLTVRPAYTFKDTDGKTKTPGIEADAVIVRMGRAASELDVMTGLYNSLPTKDFNYCQIFKAQIESSTLQSLARKEVGWSFYDQEEVAIIDMRLGMEKTFLFGHRDRFELPDGAGEVMLTGGIWEQAGREFSFGGKVDSATLAALMRRAFTASGGSRAKVMIAGSGLIEKLSLLDYTRTVQAGGKSVHWGIDFDTIVSKFGTLNVIHSEIFDLCGHPDDAIVIDPEYVTKYTHIPFSAQRLNLKQAGVRNTDAIVMTEASCVVLRYPDAHIRVTLG